jgi:hypothetical protein
MHKIRSSVTSQIFEQFAPLLAGEQLPTPLQHGLHACSDARTPKPIQDFLYIHGRLYVLIAPRGLEADILDLVRILILVT